jgi:hypothetical protein
MRLGLPKIDNSTIEFMCVTPSFWRLPRRVDTPQRLDLGTMGTWGMSRLQSIVFVIRPGVI